ncbi:hypothetical protein OHS33_13230 [Streptomyces sp. NBC_00536]|uniref:hypothetical protein n=1 Tax=Streptomyces sp. NBC_00536 TaxID=2975769 RepID=UPI002E801AC6|nr:hypothetical protein [Streptomyces sp. NBC_00536]WUC79219.1 hypothetical protein OHS33_13230 [Streptomyces sp. NBC_00536]
MIKPTLRMAALLVLAAVMATGAPVPASAAPGPADGRPAAATAPGVAGIAGWSRMDYADPRDEIRIFVDAHGLFTPQGGPAGPARSWGTFRIQHFMGAKDGEPASFNWGDFAVDCVRVDGPDVAVTGRIVDAGPGWQIFLNRERPARMGLSFHVPAPGAGATRIGITPPTPAGQPDLPKCSTRAPDADALGGAYTVTDTRRR